MSNFVKTPYGIQPSTTFMREGPSLPSLESVNVLTPDYGLQPRTDAHLVGRRNFELLEALRKDDK